MANFYKAEGIILSTRDYSEADRILTIFTKNHGKLSLIAKGVRKLSSRKRGSLEIFNQIKFSVSQNRGMGILTEVEIINSHNPIRKNLKKVALAYYFSEVISRTTREEERHDNLYDYLAQILSDLENTNKLKQLRLEFVRRSLVILGFWPAKKPLADPDFVLEEVVERKLTSTRIGKKLLS